VPQVACSQDRLLRGLFTEVRKNGILGSSG
jgi:hypothetical protein